MSNFLEFFMLKEDSEKLVSDGIFENAVKYALKDFIDLMPEGEWAIFGGLALSALS